MDFMDIAIWGMIGLVALALILFVVVLLVGKKAKKNTLLKKQLEAKEARAKEDAERNFTPHG